MNSSELKDFALAGGTGLALQIGHRISYDLDLFNQKSYNEEKLLQSLSNSFKLEVINKEANSLNLFLEGIKVDLLSYRYPLLESIQIIDGIRIFSIKDIAAMKISAISSRGSKKDFYDIYFILKIYSLEKIIEFYLNKFSMEQYYHVLKSLIYFDDAELEPNPELLAKAPSWPDIKVFFEEIVTNFIKMKQNK